MATDVGDVPPQVEAQEEGVEKSKEQPIQHDGEKSEEVVSESATSNEPDVQTQAPLVEAEKSSPNDAQMDITNDVSESKEDAVDIKPNEPDAKAIVEESNAPTEEANEEKLQDNVEQTATSIIKEEVPSNQDTSLESNPPEAKANDEVEATAASDTSADVPAPEVAASTQDETPEQEASPALDEHSMDVEESTENSLKRKRDSTDETGELNVIVSRDEMAKKEEDTGLLEFCVITNDGTPERMIQLMTLKNIFSKQLPKMPKEYIVRLVFDRNHHSMVILKNKKTVVGGICYRPFLPNHFGEIAFCAITASEQVKGYGTRLMNHLKEYVKTQGITHFLTYADNYAIGYFKKQGFSKVVSMTKSNWFGYIKDYDGGTLMECVIHQKINYLEITSMVQQQRQMILDAIKKRSKADIVYPGLTSFCDSRLVNIHAVPGVKEAGWNQTLVRNSRTSRDSSTLKQQLQTLWKSFSNHRSAWPFHEPVDVSVVTDYLDFVKHPIDLSTIQKKIEDNQYPTKAAFKDDLILMCENCLSYNSSETNYYKAAKDLLEFVKKKVTSDVDGPPSSKKSR
ncbi:hypothetical protein LEN26_008228 [Aphanomyces euteiches]|nr:hypothetical protein AeMF1_016347 [Aphanomyces euteiches]KAH9130748.1 hypothetical protein LEN26_008228 [Aphanomyces euteiches]KAH9188498.1 hypothetical protein AeNC1_009521 [Aphanomyces euteiches]